MRQEGGFGTPIESIAVLVEMFQKSKDFIQFSLPGSPQITISFFRTMINEETLHRDVLPHVPADVSSLVDLQIALPIEAMELTRNIEQISSKVLNGYAMIEDGSDTCLLIAICNKEGRQIATAEIEYNVVGPQEAFVELIDINLNMLRRRLPTPYLCVEELEIGTLSHTRVAVVFIDGIANQDNIKHVTDKLKNIEIDHIQDSSYVIRMIEDNPNSLFPQAINTERPDRVAGVLAEGKIAVLVNGSPFAITLPTTLVEFFSTSEDYNLPWIMASTFRLLRLFSVLFSMLATPLYVAVLTYHYELIPKELLRTLIASRSTIPFPPVIEALFLEVVIELLREAGARLPSKVALTVGIVGGIVIGQAAVEASLTSNILIIIVALSALSSFTTPIYKIGNTIRLTRFPLILSAQFLGMFGIVCFSLFMLTHLVRAQSLGRPYLAPFYPTRISDWKDSFVRMPISSFFSRPITARARYNKRFDKHVVDKHKSKPKNDFTD
ncbi:spore germination protein [Ectobacillus sp. JY-23]|uniref:spore germination protein n=1 Tax=Ectobacillus sp. JY-23 TaxID=2933872 RepID=UPI001FF41A90|nr:spore germination protein [Ectobacillus sp. JY-23]UOY91792.1 spore germination protein [Ectobacillus sp. JY-23]